MKTNTTKTSRPNKMKTNTTKILRSNKIAWAKTNKRKVGPSWVVFISLAFKQSSIDIRISNLSLKTNTWIYFVIRIL
ncbi:hypothetical protein T06_3816 [Trichinella sp. T6]|nr:hypothetical protein T06_3816 [Trichinella sp. T6]